MEESVIRVEGTGSIHVVPDVIRLRLSLCTLHETYEEAYAQVKSNADTLVRIMQEVSLPSSLPKTVNLDISKKMRPVYDNHHNRIGEKFAGFVLDHRVKIDIGMDTTLLNTLTRLIGERLKQAELDIGYTVRDPRPLRLRMLARAVHDAKEKATIMAEAAGCTLCGVKKIDSSANSEQMYSQARNIHSAHEAATCNTYSLDITPDDWAVEDKVTVEWYLRPAEKKDE